MRIPSDLTALGAALLVGISGCATHTEVEKRINGSAVEAGDLYKRMDGARQTGAVVRNKGARLVGQEIDIVKSKPEPDWLRQPYTYVTAHQSVQEILATISQNIGVPVEITPDAVQFVSGRKAHHAGWHGALRGFLDQVALRTGLYWKFDPTQGGRIVFFREETRNFHVYLPGGKSSISSSIALENEGGSGSVSVNSSGVVDAYDSLAKSIASIVNGGEVSTGGAGGGGGGKVSVNPSLGIVTVTGTPPVLSRVEEYVRGVNDRFARNVMIGIKVLNLSLKSEANVGASVQDVFQRFASRWNYSLSGMPPLQPGSGTPGTFVLDRASGNHSTEIFVQALETLGDVSLVTSGQVIAANGQPAPLRIGNEISYLASSSTTSTPDAGVTVSLTPGKQGTGFTANFLPTILGDNRILLQYQLNLSSLLSLDQIASGGSMIQTPNVATQALQQQAFLKDGQSIVLFGFEGVRDTRDTALGIGGVSKNSAGNRQMMVIVMEVFSGPQ